MTEQDKCSQCGSALPSSVRGGLCPACLLKRGLETNTIGYTAGATGGSGWKPPAVEELSAVFEEFDILELIGRGGMGAVYKAREKRLDRLVALKILPPEMAHDAAFAQRFTREAQAMARLNHTNIVTIHSFGQRGEFYFFIMEYVDGLSLRQLLNVGQVSPKEALAIVPQICDALQYAHDRGIVHRDIKPENILLNRVGQVKIADFGLAKLVGGSAADAAAASEKVMGTPQYMAPEQVQRPQEVDHRADIYSLGVVFYQMLTGELPTGKFEPPSHRVLIDVRLDEVVLRALEKSPARRYQQASQVKTQVETIIATPASVAPSQATLYRVGRVRVERWHRWVAVVGVRGGKPVMNWRGVLVFAIGMISIWALTSAVVYWRDPRGFSILPGSMAAAAIFLLAIPIGIYIGLRRPVERLTPLDEPPPSTDSPPGRAQPAGAGDAPGVRVDLEWNNRKRDFSFPLVGARDGRRVIYWPGVVLASLITAALASFGAFLFDLVLYRLTGVSLIGWSFAAIAVGGAIIVVGTGIRQAYKLPVERLTQLEAKPGPVEMTPQLEHARQAVKAPAFGLLVVAAIHLGLLITVIIGAITSVPPVWTHDYAFPFVAALVLAALAGNIFVVVAASRMRQLRNRRLAIDAAVVALFPLGSPLGLIVGIWALVVLNRREVREAFVAALTDKKRTTKPSPNLTFVKLPWIIVLFIRVVYVLAVLVAMWPFFGLGMDPDDRGHLVRFILCPLIAIGIAFVGGFLTLLAELIVKRIHDGRPPLGRPVVPLSPAMVAAIVASLMGVGYLAGVSADRLWAEKDDVGRETESDALRIPANLKQMGVPATQGPAISETDAQVRRLEGEILQLEEQVELETKFKLESHPQVKWLRERIAIVKKRLEKAKAAPATQPPGGSLDTRPWTGEPKIPAPLPAGQTASFTLKPLVGEITTTWPCVDLDTGRESTLGQSSASSAGDLIVTRMQGQPQSLIFVVDRAELREMPKGQDTSGLWDAPNPAAALALATEPGSFAYPARQAPYVLAYKTKFGQVGLIKVEDASPEQARISIRLLISKAAPATSRSAPAAAPATGPEAVSGTDSQVRRLEREIAESEEQLELYIRTQHVLESHPQVKSMREKIAALKERLEKAKAAPATQASETADKTAVTEAALNVLKAIKDDDLNALKDLSAGAVQGWVQAPSEPAAILAGTEGWTVDYLKSAAREIRRTLAKSPEFGQGVVETAIQGDFAATRSPAVKSGSSEQYLIMVFVRTNKGWRFATMHDARGPLAEELSKHTLRIPANLKRMGVPATQTNQSSSRLSVLLRALFCALDTTEDKLMEADIHGITCGRPSPACCLLRAWRPSQVDWRSRLPSRAWSPGRA